MQKRDRNTARPVVGEADDLGKSSAKEADERYAGSTCERTDKVTGQNSKPDNKKINEGKIRYWPRYACPRRLKITLYYR